MYTCEIVNGGVYVHVGISSWDGGVGTTYRSNERQVQAIHIVW